MRRRALLTAALAAATGCLGRLPGGTGPRLPPRSPEGRPRTREPESFLFVDELDFEATEAGRLRVFGSVRNRGNGTLSGRLTVTVTAGDRELRRGTDVSVPADGAVPFEFAFPVAYEEFTTNGSVSTSLE